MKVLWVSTAIVGQAAKILHSDYNRSSATWITTEYEELDKNVEVVFLCGTRKKMNDLFESNTNENGTAYCIHLPSPATGVAPTPVFLSTIEKIIDIVEPDIIHIWGTETCLQTAVSLVKPNIPKVVFIQGILGVHKRYMGGYFHIPYSEYCSLKGIKTYWSSKIQRRLFIKQAQFEIETVNRAGHLIIDNDFSKAYFNSVSNKIEYFYRKLNANDLFYEKEWNINTCIKKRIFTVYSSSPDKGLQQLILAMSIVKKKHPNVCLCVPGPYSMKLTNQKVTKDSYSSNPYERSLIKLINQHLLNENVLFLGKLTQAEMANEIEKCQVYVNPSIMEVHALSLREAMAVGAPCISSLCGSVSEYLNNKENGMLYRYEEPEMLAQLINNLFDSEELCIMLGTNAKKTMKKPQNADSLESIYNRILME